MVSCAHYYVCSFGNYKTNASANSTIIIQKQRCLYISTILMENKYRYLHVGRCNEMSDNE